jgi:hypothetical protein
VHVQDLHVTRRSLHVDEARRVFDGSGEHPLRA